jgi:mediator of RNA polymerase II transcription subunit 25
MMQINAIMKQNGVGLPQTMIAQLAKMNPAEQNGWMKKLIQTGLEQRRHKLAAAAAAGGVPAGLGGANSSVAAGMSVPQMGMMPQMGQQQQHKQPQQHQPDLGGFNPAQFALGGGPTGMGGAMGGAMGVGSSGMYPDIMASAGLPRTASNGGGGSGGAVSYEMMQSFMQRNQEIGGGSNAGN